MWLVFQPSPSCTLCVGWGSLWQRHGAHTCTLTLCVCIRLLSNNLLSGTIPGSIVSMASLASLFVPTHATLAGLPQSHTPVLLLSGRQLNANSALSGSIPSNLGQIATLEQLYAQDTSLSGSLPDLSNTQLSVL